MAVLVVTVSGRDFSFGQPAERCTQAIEAIDCGEWIVDAGGERANRNFDEPVDIVNFKS